MGINKLYEIIKEHAPQQLVLFKLDELRGTKMAVDISIFLYKSVLTAGLERSEWLNNFVRVLTTLKQYEIQTVCIFDGPNAPEEKMMERKRRKEQARTNKEKLENLLNLQKIVNEHMENYRFYGIPSSLKKALTDVGIEMNENSDVDQIAENIKVVVRKCNNQACAVTSEVTDQAKEIMDILGINYFQTDGEAEKYCAWLCINKFVDGVLSEDTDVMAYGAPLVFSFKELATNSGSIYGIHTASLYKELGLSYEEFRDMCIFLKCDYNRFLDDDGGPVAVSYTIYGHPPNQKSNKSVTIGPKKVWAMIQEYRTLDVIANHLTNPEGLKIRRCRELFSFTPKYIKTEKLDKDILIVRKTTVDEKRLAKFLQKHGLYLNIDNIVGIFSY
jgi:5'-3' exonuclease